jgi:hypothetical protein
MEYNYMNGGDVGAQFKQMKEEFLKLVKSVNFCTPEGKMYKLKIDYTFRDINELRQHACFQIVEAKEEENTIVENVKVEQLKEVKKENAIEENKTQSGGYSDINTLNSIFNNNTIQQGGGKKVFSSTSNMFNGFQNGGYVNTTTTSLNSELDLSIFSQLESGKNYNQRGGELSTLASLFD